MDKTLQEFFMAAALEQSRLALPHCRPNPPVGCVLVKNDRIVATGHTQAPGGFHAEAMALALYTGPMHGVSAFVTLEPCSFHGRTPSCANALIKRGVGTVYVALRDPDARNDGNGLALLAAAGIDVHENVLADTVARFLGAYLQHKK